MAHVTVLSPGQRLPLTCTRLGTCCHGKLVWVNPWEVDRLAAAAQMTTADLIARHTTDGGIRLRFDGAPGWKGQAACTFYDPAAGCRHHAGRPLACRLYPLGRQRQGAAVRYTHDGKRFPCLDGCPGVRDLPQLTVSEYLDGQGIGPGELAADAYLEVMQNLAEVAFTLILEGDLPIDQRRREVAAWSALAGDLAGRLAAIGDDWLRRLIDPQLPDAIAHDAPQTFVEAHQAHLNAALTIAGWPPPDPVATARRTMAMALHLGQSLGAPVDELCRHWQATARKAMG